MGHEHGHAAFHQTRRHGLLIDEGPEEEVLHQGEQLTGREDRGSLLRSAPSSIACATSCVTG